MKQIITLFAIIVSLCSFSAKANTPLNYRGSIGKYYAEMHITIGTNGNVDGYYQYFENNKATTSRLRLKGTWKSLNIQGTTALNMKEYTPKGRISGTWNVRIETRGTEMYGTFTTSKGEKFKVNMEEY